MTPAEQVRAESLDTFRRFVLMLAEMEAQIVGWEQTALTLAECSSEALAHAAEHREPRHPSDQAELGR